MNRVIVPSSFSSQSSKYMFKRDIFTLILTLLPEETLKESEQQQGFCWSTKPALTDTHYT